MSEDKVTELEESVEEAGEKESPAENVKEDVDAASNEPGEDCSASDDGGAEGDSATDGSGKSKRRSSKQSWLIEVVAVIVLFYVTLSGLSGKFMFRKFAPFKVEANAVVSSIDEIAFVGSYEDAMKIGDLADSKYAVVFTYAVNGGIHTSELYCKEYPKYSVGDEVTIYVDATDLDSIISVK